MDSFSDQLGKVLSDPESLQKITKIAQSLAITNQTPSAKKSEDAPKESTAPCGDTPAPLPFVADALRLFQNGSRERLMLLQAMRPFVQEEKRIRLDRIIQTLKMLDLLSLSQKSL